MHGSDINQVHAIGAMHEGIGACVAWRMNRFLVGWLNEELNVDAPDKFKF